MQEMKNCQNKMKKLHLSVGKFGRNTNTSKIARNLEVGGRMKFKILLAV